MCLVGVSAYAGMSAIQETDTFAENALKEGSFPLTFQHSTTNAWSAGGGKVQSTNKDDNSEGWFSTTFELTFDATISFEWYVNSEYSDRLYFYVDGREIQSIGGTDMANFSEVTHQLAPGVHTIKWSYQKMEVPLPDLMKLKSGTFSSLRMPLSWQEWDALYATPRYTSAM